MLNSVSGLTSIWGDCEIKGAVDIIVIMVEIDPLSVRIKALERAYSVLLRFGFTR